MAIKDWQYDSIVPVLIQEMSTDKEADVGREQTPAGDKTMPKKPKPSQKMAQQKKGGAPNKGTQTGKKDTTQAPQEQEKEVEIEEGTKSSATQQEQGQTKRFIIHTWGVRKKAKAHKMPPEYTITKEYVDLMVEMVQDQIAEEFEEAQHQRDRIQDELANMRKLLEQIIEMQSCWVCVIFFACVCVGTSDMTTASDDPS
jgi:hypothetical protein